MEAVRGKELTVDLKTMKLSNERSKEEGRVRRVDPARMSTRNQQLLVFYMCIVLHGILIFLWHNYDGMMLYVPSFA